MTMRDLANEIYEAVVDMDFMDYADSKETDMENLLDDLNLLSERGNGSLLNAIAMLLEKK